MGKYLDPNYNKKYQKRKYIQQTIKWDKEQDADILDLLSNVENKTEYIRSLILKELKENYNG